MTTLSRLVIFFQLLLLPLVGVANEPVKLKMCAFTLLGERSPELELIKDYQLAALGWGVELDIKASMSEHVIASDLKAGHCDIASMTSSAAHGFNAFAGSLGAMGAIPDYQHLKVALTVLNGEKARPLLQGDGYEVLGIQPSGAVYLFLNDRYLSGIPDLAGRRVAVLDNFPEMHEMVTNLGMTPVSSTVSNMFQKFNNGSVDIVGGPAIIYEVMELHKGLKDTGGMVEAPVMQSTIQFIGRQDKLPEDFAKKSREYFLKQFDDSVALLKKTESAVPRKYRIPLAKCNRDEFDKHNRKIRLQFRDKGIYHPKMLSLLRKVRCRLDATRAECTASDAE